MVELIVPISKNGLTLDSSRLEDRTSDCSNVYWCKRIRVRFQCHNGKAGNLRREGEVPVVLHRED